MATKRRANSLVWGIILILLGALFLLGNVNVDVWDVLARMWPVALIVWGAVKFYYGLKEKQELPATKPKQEKQ